MVRGDLGELALVDILVPIGRYICPFVVDNDSEVGIKVSRISLEFRIRLRLIYDLAFAVGIRIYRIDGYV